MKDLAKIAVIVPCYNEASTVAKVISGFQDAFPQAEIWVCGNASNDDTKAVAIAAGPMVLSQPLKGKGHAVRRLFCEVDADVYVLMNCARQVSSSSGERSSFDLRPAMTLGTLGTLAALASAGLAVPVVLHWLNTGLVPRLPTAVLSCGLALLSALFGCAGLVLDGVARARREAKQIAYLSTARIQGDGTTR